MTLKHALVTTGLATALLLGSASASAASRSACDPGRADTEGVLQSADGHAASLDAAHPAALANWSVRSWQRHRLWITLEAENRGEVQAHLLPQVALDLQPNGGASALLDGLPIALAPHARATQRLSAYLPDDTRTLGVRVLSASPVPEVALRFALECSDARFDAGQLAPPAQALLDGALHDWFDGFVDPLRDPQATLRTAVRLASGAQDGEDVRWALRGLMQSVGDDHGFVLGPGQPPPAPRTPATRAPEFAWLDNGVAVVRLHALDTRDEAGALAWAQALHDGIAALAVRHPAGWIVDLREHEAASPWAALAGLSTLLAGPVVGATVGRREQQQWVVERGAARVAGAPAMVDLQAPPEPSFDGPLAVLIGPGTRDAGEEVAVALRGRERTRFFGEPSAGFPTLGLRVHRLADGGSLGVLETRAADRTGAVYRAALMPDEAVRGVAGDTPQAVLTWLQDAR